MTELTTPLADAGIALGPLDGRYRPSVAPLVEFLSEAALNKMRLHVEVEWLLFLSSRGVVPGARELDDTAHKRLREVVTTFDAHDVARLAQLEKETAHDVKAVEYFLKEKLLAFGYGDVSELVHFCCTSEDINNLAYAIMVQLTIQEVWLPQAHELIEQIRAMAREHQAVPMLSRTHGQAATPTTVGKELAVMAHRLHRQVLRIERTQYLGKINGATGTYGAHLAAVPGADWIALSKEFVEGVGLTWNPLTTQIESHDWQAELYSDVARFNRILHNICSDMWTYISLGFFAQQLDAHGSTGSSTMPHKVNPIRFENAEANLEVSCALFDVLANTLVTSRMQRDLTDSSMQRNIGVAFGHSMLAMENVERGLRGVAVDEAVLRADLDANWEVLGEAIQTAMRAAGIAGHPGMSQPYERLKELTRGQRVDAARMQMFVSELGLPEDVEERLLALTPATYVGAAEELVKRYCNE